MQQRFHFQVFTVLYMSPSNWEILVTLSDETHKVVALKQSYTVVVTDELWATHHQT